MDLRHLKSGSDVRGTALDILGAPVTLTDDAVAAVTGAFYYYMRNHRRGKSVAVGCDSRLSSPHIKSIVIDTLLKAGADTLDIGLCSTPSVYMMTQFESTGADLGVMITASHHPKDKNGLKFFDKTGGLSGKDITNILDLASYGVTSVPAKPGELKTGDYFSLYCDHLTGLVRDALGGETPLAGLKIVVDAGNGAGGFYAQRVLQPLGADTSGSIFLEPDGEFPNHSPNPEDKTAMRCISDCVTKNKADLGVIFDTDVDRAAVVGDGGEEINRNALIALTAKMVLQSSPGATIVTDSVTSLGLTDFIKAAGGVHHRFKRGYRNVIDEAMRLKREGTNAPVAMETSGHAAFAENYFLDDGAYLVTRIIIEAARLKQENKSITALIDTLTSPASEAEVRLTITDPQWQALGKAAVDGLTQLKSDKIEIAEDSCEGVRLLVKKLEGFVMLRQSVHDPVLVINAESGKNGGAKTLLSLIDRYLSAITGIDLAPLKDALL